MTYVGNEAALLRDPRIGFSYCWRPQRLATHMLQPVGDS